MICCEDCFNDTELKSIIRGNNTKGICPLCHSKNTFIYDTSINYELLDSIENLISIYHPVSSLNKKYPKRKTKSLKEILLADWDIFNQKSNSKIVDIIVGEILEKKYLSKKLVKAPFDIPEVYNPKYLEEKSLVKTNEWNNFTKSIKEENRFHTKQINTEILENFCTYIKITYPKGTTFYRGRISSKEGYEKKNMGAPPHSCASAGRVNSLGVSCLYLADSIYTVMHEIRASAFDYVSIGTFELKKDITIVDLSRINKISPFMDGLDIVQYAINKKHFEKINMEMGKPLRRNDSILEYIPTQYISEFIKSVTYDEKIQYSGLKYNSTFNELGYNLAIFYPKLFQCTNVCIHEIQNIQYIYK